MKSNLTQKKIVVSWAIGTSPIMNVDFGVFSAHKLNQITVDKKFWDKYCDIRLQFELMQKELAEKVCGRKLDNL